MAIKVTYIKGSLFMQAKCKRGVNVNGLNGGREEKRIEKTKGLTK